MSISERRSFTFSSRSFLPAKRSVLIFIFLLFLATENYGQILPKGFNQVLVTGGITDPTAMAFSPDGRLFVAQQAGALRIVKNGVLLQEPFIKLKVNSRGERGLLGIAFDPAFSTNKYIYLYYTDTSGSNNRISRFTANGNVVVPGSEVVVLNLSRLSTAVIHNGGNMLFGKDGKLYVGVGDNKNAANSQNLNTYLGKILRINPDGSVPQNNPFTSGSEERKRIWAYGMRNPYTLAIDPVTGKIFANDVGQDMWEEVDDCTAGGRNYGWPLAEGKDTTANFTNPVYTYGHGDGSGLGCSISGGTFFNPSRSNYPSSFIGKYFFLDYCGRWIDVISFKNGTTTRTSFASSIPKGPVCMATSPNGDIYFLSRIMNAVYKITYTTSEVPVINEQPAGITVSKGNAANFFVKASSINSISYQWRKNGVNIKGATNASYSIPAVNYVDSGAYSVVVTNSAGTVKSRNAVLKVTPPNQKPVAVIKTPLKGATYAGGNKISFSGSGTDYEDSILPASAFKWFVVFHHKMHTHPGPGISSHVTRGSFTIPDIGETSSQVFYRLYLIVTDSKGAKDTSFTDILPRKSSITIKTNPANLRITLDGQPFSSPLTVTSVEGMIRTIGVVSPQGNYRFSSWNNSGDTDQTFSTPVSDVTYTANFSEILRDTLLPVADAFVRSGAESNNNYGADTILYSKKSSTDGYDREVYLKFDISSFSPDVSSAVLRLYGGLNSTENAGVPVEVHNVIDDTWSESVITWNNKPFADTFVLATKIIADTLYKHYNLDITQHVKNLKKAGVNFVTLKLVSSKISLSRFQFNSREAKKNKPRLIITYSSVAAQQKPMLVSKEKPDNTFDFSIYPNPATNTFNVIVKRTLKTNVLELFDAKGRRLRNISITNNRIEQVYAGDLDDGIYIVTLRDGRKTTSKKLIIAK